MSPIYYIGLRVPLSEEDPGQPDLVLASTLLSRLHRAAHGRAFGIALPQCREGERPAMGGEIQVFSQARETLEYILSNPTVHRFVRDHCFGVPAIRLVPEMRIVSWARYVRDRRVDRVSPSRLRRQQARLERGLRQQPAMEVPANGGHGVAALPHFWHTSLSTSQRVCIYVRREAATGPGNFCFDAFGLSKGGAVPVLRG